MAAEVGAELSGMEFSNAYGIAAAGSTVTKTAYYGYATFFHGDGRVIEGAGSLNGRSVIAETLLQEKVFAQLDRANEDVQQKMRRGQPNFFLQFDRQGINPFTDRFEVDLLAEGTVRGTGGINVIDDSCATTVPGLYAAGDAATRERICGGFTGGGSHNSAWAMSSGTWAGAGAAAHALRQRKVATADVLGAGRAGLNPSGKRTLSADDVIAAAQSQLLPFDKNYLRHGDRMVDAADELDRLWIDLSSGLAPTDGIERIRSRQAAAITAVGRWMYRSALSRTESRGMSKRDDHPGLDPHQHHHILTGGLDHVWTSTSPAESAALAQAS
jgi:succinate dehydrogenase/fumarate reductase flavoprotein subunit